MTNLSFWLKYSVKQKYKSTRYTTHPYIFNIHLLTTLSPHIHVWASTRDFGMYSISPQWRHSLLARAFAAQIHIVYTTYMIFMGSNFSNFKRLSYWRTLNLAVSFFMINPHESIGPGRDQTRDPWIYCWLGCKAATQTKDKKTTEIQCAGSNWKYSDSDANR